MQGPHPLLGHLGPDIAWHLQPDDHTGPGFDVGLAQRGLEELPVGHDVLGGPGGTLAVAVQELLLLEILGPVEAGIVHFSRHCDVVPGAFRVVMLASN